MMPHNLLAKAELWVRLGVRPCLIYGTCIIYDDCHMVMVK
jgi:hypothetical protein